MSCTAVWCAVLWHGRFQNNLKYLIFPIHDSLEHDLSLLPPGPSVVQCGCLDYFHFPIYHYNDNTSSILHLGPTQSFFTSHLVRI